MYKGSRQDSGHKNFSYARYAEKPFTQIYRYIYIYFVRRRHVGAHVGAHPDGHKHGGRKPTEASVTEVCYKSVNLSLGELKNIKIIIFLIQELFR